MTRHPVALVTGGSRGIGRAAVLRFALITMSDDDWIAVLRTNVDGTFHACRAAMVGMLKRRRGAVVTLSSVMGRNGNAGQANYSAAKAAISGFTMAAAREAGRYGVASTPSRPASSPPT